MFTWKLQWRYECIGLQKCLKIYDLTKFVVLALFEIVWFYLRLFTFDLFHLPPPPPYTSRNFCMLSSHVHLGLIVLCKCIFACYYFFLSYQIPFAIFPHPPSSNVGEQLLYNTLLISNFSPYQLSWCISAMHTLHVCQCRFNSKMTRNSKTPR